MILGIDQSLTGTGLVVLGKKGELEFAATIAPKELKGVERLDFIINGIKSIFSGYAITAIGMEDYAFSGNGLASLGELGGVIKYMLFKEYKIKPMILHNSKIKKWATGKGNADKNLVMMKTFQKYGIELKNDNEYDALNIAKIVYWYNEGQDKGFNPKLTKPEIDVLKSLTSKQ